MFWTGRDISQIEHDFERKTVKCFEREKSCRIPILRNVGQKALRTCAVEIHLWTDGNTGRHLSILQAF